MTGAEFQQALQLGKKRSDCSPDCIDLLVEQIAAHARAGIAGDIVECGSYRCGATIAMAAAADYYYMDKNVFAFDLWGGLPYGAGNEFENFADVDFEEVKQAVAPFYIHLVRGKHEETVPEFIPRTNEFSLLFMDSDFYDSHVVCLRKFWPLIVRNGCVMFHDWTFQGVQRAIKDTVDEREYNRYDLPHTNMGMIVKK